MTRHRHCCEDRRTEFGDKAQSRQDWSVMGARIRRAAMVATSLHLVHSAGGSLDNGTVLETPWDDSGR